MTVWLIVRVVSAGEMFSSGEFCHEYTMSEFFHAIDMARGKARSVCVIGKALNVTQGDVCVRPHGPLPTGIRQTAR